MGLWSPGNVTVALQNWFDWGAAAAAAEEYAEARMIFEAGIHQCGPENSEMLISALGQMRRSQTSVAGDEQVQWPGKGDETPYIASEHTFTRYSVHEPPPMCARGSLHKSGEGIVCVSNEPILDPAECKWVVSEVDRVAADGWKQDAKKGTIGTDKIWARPFPDRLWMREVPGLVDWFEHRLRTRLFPMLQSLYPDIIPNADDLRCHDAFVVRYDAEGMSELELHQDTTYAASVAALCEMRRYGIEGSGVSSKRRAFTLPTVLPPLPAPG